MSCLHFGGDEGPGLYNCLSVSKRSHKQLNRNCMKLYND